MSFVYSGLSRSDRLLPLESVDVLAATDRYRLHVLDPECDAKLSTHVAFYWDQQREYQRYQQRLLREVRSTRGPVRFVGFPQVRHSATLSSSPAHHHTPDASSRTAAGAGGAADTTATASSASATATPSPRAAEAATSVSALQPPRSLAAWNWIRLVAPYERLLCPSLLFSALLSPAVGASTGLPYGVTPSPTFAPPPPLTTSTPPLSNSAQWSAQTCRTLWSLHESAAASSLPAQEVYVLCAGTLLYLDVVLASGRVWAELEGLWGAGFADDDDDDDEARAKSEERRCDENEEEKNTSARWSELASWKAFLSQPPQTYASVLQHLRVLLEALVFAPPPSWSGPSSSSNASAKAAAHPRPFAAWLQSAMAAEAWTAASTPASPSTDKAAAAAASSSLPHTSATAQVLRLAVREWLSRRGATVTATAPTGSRAVAVPPRDLHISPAAPSVQKTHRGSAEATASCAAAPHTTCSPSSAAEGSTSTSTATMRANAAANEPHPRTGAAPTSSASASSLAFEPFESHDTPREQHPFLLPPLPQDPALLVCAAVWRRTLQRCVAEKDVVRQQLRQVILGQAGQRCEELLREVAHQREEQKTKEAASGRLTGAVSGVDGRSPANKDAHKGLADKEALGASQDSTVQPPQFSAPLVLLTDDPGTTSFRVLGPRSGEWVTSRTGAWGGFRGELFCCVSPPPPTPPASLSPKPKTSGTSPRSSSFAASPALPLRVPFLDGALELDANTNRAVVPSTTSTVTTTKPTTTTTTTTTTATLVTTEELADRLCRLGAALPRYATEISGGHLRPVDADFACEVLQQQCLPLFLACKRRGIQQWSLRGWLKGIALTMLDNSGTESRVTTPAKLMEMGRQQLTTAMGGIADAADTAAALRIVMGGGLSEVLAFLEHLQKRKDRTLRWLPVRKAAKSAIAAAAPATHIPLVSFSAVEALLLRRAEESALFSIFQCHPLALPLSGCGVQRLALHAGPHKSASTLLLARTCGVVAEWDVQDCYEGPRHRRLRAPKRLAPFSSGRRANANGVDVTDPLLPLEINGAVERLTLWHVRAMLQYYGRTLRPPPSAPVGLSPAAMPMAMSVPERKAGEGSVESEEPSSNSGFDTSAFKENEQKTEEAPPIGVKRLREDDSVPVSDATIAAAATTAAAVASVADGPAVKREGEATPIKKESDGEETSSTSPAHGSSPSQPPTRSTVPPECTGMFPIDRAVALFVLRHHPHYFTQIVGCGIKDIYVTFGSSAEDAAPLPRAAVHENESAATKTRPALETSTKAEAKSAAMTPSATNASSPTTGETRRPILLVERVCGQRVEVSVEACYDESREGCPLRPRMVLA